jgi:uncharacterized membrane protein YphA (DoxX/SURF4 family)
VTAGLDPVFAWVIRLTLALLFGLAAWHKLRDLPEFKSTLANYRLLPAAIVAPTALALAACELGVAVLLLAPLAEPLARHATLGPLSSIAPLAALGLLALYSGALAVNLARGRRDLDCGCLGPAQRQPISPGLLARNAVVALGPGLLLLQGATEGAGRTTSWIDGLSIVGATAMISLIWSAAHQLAAALPPHTELERSR